MRKLGWSGLMAVALMAWASFAMASEWSRYGNARFQYGIDIPPGFPSIAESDSGDGGVSATPDGRAKLMVWGSFLVDRSFAAEMQWRIGQARAAGWDITYQKHQAKWAAWSGVKGNRIVYQRGIAACRDAAAYFRLEYDKDQAKVFDPIVARLSKSLRGEC